MEMEGAQPRTEGRNGRLKTLPFILGQQTLEFIAKAILMSTISTFMKHCNASELHITAFIYVWKMTVLLSSFVASVVSDVFFGRFKVMLLSCFAMLGGMTIMTLVALAHSLRNPNTNLSAVEGVFLISGVILYSIGHGSTRACSIPFGADQFSTLPPTVRGVSMYYSWYYMSFIVSLIAGEVLRNHIAFTGHWWKWVARFGFALTLMLFSTALYLLGGKLYVRVPIESDYQLPSMFRTLVVAFKKRHITIPKEVGDGLFLDPPVEPCYNPPLNINEFRWLSKAAFIKEEDGVNQDKTLWNKWRISTIQQVEELKCVLRVYLLWPTFVIFSCVSLDAAVMITLRSRDVVQGFNNATDKVDYYATLSWLLINELVIIRILRRYTGNQDGISILKRMGAGIVLCLMTLKLSGMIFEEAYQRKQNPTYSMVVVRLVIIGVSRALGEAGQLEFFHNEFPPRMCTLASSIFFSTWTVGNYASELIEAIRDALGLKSSDAGKDAYLSSYISAVITFLSLLYYIAITTKLSYRK